MTSSELPFAANENRTRRSNETRRRARGSDRHLERSTAAARPPPPRTETSLKLQRGLARAHDERPRAPTRSATIRSSAAARDPLNVAGHARLVVIARALRDLDDVEAEPGDQAVLQTDAGISPSDRRRRASRHRLLDRQAHLADLAITVAVAEDRRSDRRLSAALLAAPPPAATRVPLRQGLRRRRRRRGDRAGVGGVSAAGGGRGRLERLEVA